MHKPIVFITLATLMVAGCAKKDETVITGADGSTLTMSKDGTNMSVTDDKGRVVTMNKDDKGGVTVNDGKGGNVSIGNGTVTEAELGVPFYPGSTEAKNGASNTMEAEGKKVATSYRTTADDPAKVAEFYKPKVRAPSTAKSDAGGYKMASVSGMLEDETEISITATKQNAEETVIIIIASKKTGK